MSYINEALRKAQKQRETHYQECSGGISRLARKGKILPRHSVWWISAIFVFTLLAFAVYSWLDSKSPAIQSKPEHKRKESAVITQRKSVVDPKKIFDKANLFHKSGRLRDAKRLYRETLKIDPGYVDALNNLGVIFIHDRNLSAARRSFEKAIRLDPGNVDPYYNLACVCAAGNEIEKSLTYLKRAISLDKSAIDWARKDTDLNRLRGLSEFNKIMGKKESR